MVLFHCNINTDRLLVIYTQVIKRLVNTATVQSQLDYGFLPNQVSVQHFQNTKVFYIKPVSAWYNDLPDYVLHHPLNTTSGPNFMVDIFHIDDSLATQGAMAYVAMAKSTFHMRQCISILAPYCASVDERKITHQIWYVLHCDKNESKISVDHNLIS